MRKTRSKTESSWRSPHKPVKSTWNGEKLMTTKYVGGVRRKHGYDVRDGWRGIDRSMMFIVGNAKCVALPRLPKYVEEFNNRNGFPNPKQFTRG